MIRLKNADAAAKPCPRGENGQNSAPQQPAAVQAAAANAEEAAIAALSFIGQNEKLLERFLRISGIAPENLRQAAAQRGFLAGALNFLLEHEPDLLEFCAQTNRKPESIVRAFAALPGGRALQR